MLTPRSENHLPGCRTILFGDIYREQGLPLPEGVEEADATGSGIVDCADGCPDLARRLERARKIAREHGWLQ